MRRIAAIILMTLTAGAGAARADMPYATHASCNNGWKASKAYNDQGCRSYQINADHYDQEGYIICFYDVYCDRGEWWQRASRKGRNLTPAGLRMLHRCANNPRKLEHSGCDPITDEQLRADAEQYE